MRTEADFTNFIKNRLSAVNIPAELESTTNIEIANALKTASKNFTGKSGYPDIIAVFDDYVLVMENKSDQFKLVQRDGNGYSMTSDDVKNYAINGALFYAKKILENTHYTKIFAFGNVGDRVHHTFKPVFVDANIIKELPEVETFIDFNAKNINAYYERVILNKKPLAEIKLKEITSQAGKLHEMLRNYGQLGDTEKPLVVSAIILALDQKDFSISQLIGDTESNDGTKIFTAVENALKRAKVQSEVKRERVLDQLRLIKNRPLLNTSHKKLGTSPLRHFAQYIKDNIYDKVKNLDKDYLGMFYREFIKYSGGDGQSLGVVLTPDHITELFCDLVDLQVDDVVLDPCCGTGGFLIAAMNRMLSLANTDNQRDHIKAKQLHGIEIRDDMFAIATTSMVLRNDGKSNLICDDFFAKNASDLQLLSDGVTVGMMNPPYSQAKNDDTKHLSELRFIEHLLNSVINGGRVAAIVPVSAMIGKTKDDKIVKREILKHHTLKGVISLNKNTFYQIGVVPCIAVFEAGKPHDGKVATFINFDDDGYELKKHEGYVKTERFTDRRQYLLDCWRGKVDNVPSKFMVKTAVEADDEWVHSFYYYNDELPTEDDFINTIADYLTFEFNMIVHGRGYLFNGAKKNTTLIEEVPPLESKQWKSFIVGDLFKIFLPSGDTQADKCNEGDIPLISAGFNNNGVCKFINCGDKDSMLYNGNIISVDMFGKSFFHEYKFYSVSHGRINLLESLKPLNRFHLQFLTVIINTSSNGKFSYNQMCSSKRLGKLTILLPVNDTGEPDYDYMEKYIVQRENKLINQYLDYTAPPHLASELVPLNKKIWKAFLIVDIFEIKHGKRLTKSDMTAGNMPFIGATDSNNGITAFVDNHNSSEDENVLGVNYNGSVVETFYHSYRCIFSDDVKRFKLKSFDGNKYVYLFLKTMIIQQKSKYTYGYKFNESRMRQQKIMLPVNNIGEPDYQYMENYIRLHQRNLIQQYLLTRK